MMITEEEKSIGLINCRCVDRDLYSLSWIIIPAKMMLAPYQETRKVNFEKSFQHKRGPPW